MKRPKVLSTSRGQLLLFVLFLLLITAIMAGGLSAVWESGVQTTGLERNTILAFYLSQAGIEHAKIWVKYNSGTTTQSNIALGQGRYSFTVANLGGNSRRLTATGEVLAGSEIIAKRQIRVDVDRVALTQASDTWQEI